MSPYLSDMLAENSEYMAATSDIWSSFSYEITTMSERSREFVKYSFIIADPLDDSVSELDMSVMS